MSGFYDTNTFFFRDDILDFVLDSFFAVAVSLGIINLINQKFSLFIYQFSLKHIPRLHWYASFWGWIIIAHRYIPDFNFVFVLFFCCIIAALCYPHGTWKQKGCSALIFSILWLFIYLGKFFDFD